MIIRASLRLIFCWSLVAAFQGSVAFCQNTQSSPFRILVLGDSVMWGQGLKDEHKFSFKVRDWICARRHVAGRCENADDVQVHVEAHSGAVITRPLTAVQKNEEDQFLRTESPRVLAANDFLVDARAQARRCHLRMYQSRSAQEHYRQG